MQFEPFSKLRDHRNPKRVQMIRGLINQMMTFLEDKLSIITGAI